MTDHEKDRELTPAEKLEAIKALPSGNVFKPNAARERNKVRQASWGTAAAYQPGDIVMAPARPRTRWQRLWDWLLRRDPPTTETWRCVE